MRHRLRAAHAAACPPACPSALAELPSAIFTVVCSFLPLTDQIWHVLRLCHRLRAMTLPLQLVAAVVVDSETDERSVMSAVRHLCCSKLQRLELRDMSPQDAMGLLLRRAPQLQQLSHLSIRSRARFYPSTVIDWRSVSLPGLQSLSLRCERRSSDPLFFSSPAVTGFESFLDRHPSLASLTSDIAELWTEERLLRLLQSARLHSWTAARIDLSALGRAIAIAETAAATAAVVISNNGPQLITLLPRLCSLTLELDITRAAQQTLVADCKTLLELLCQRCSESLQRLSLAVCNSGSCRTEWTVSSAAAIPAHRLSACRRLRSLRLDGLFTQALLHRGQLRGAEAWPLLQKLELSIIDATMPVQHLAALLCGWTGLQDISVRVLGADCCMRALRLLPVIGLHCPNAERLQLRACELSAGRSSFSRQQGDCLQPARPGLQLADVQAVIDSQPLPESAFSCLRSLELRFDVETGEAAAAPPDVWRLLLRRWLSNAPLHSVKPAVDEEDTAGELLGFGQRRWRWGCGCNGTDSKPQSSCGCCIA